jgi:SPP1 family predicted phage head-tail adaptor
MGGKRRFSGRLNKRLAFYVPVRSSSSGGAVTEVLGDAAFTAWGALWPVAAAEQVKNSREGMDITHRIQIRYRDGVTHDMVVKYGDRVFDIESIINPEETNHRLDILAREAV